MKPGLLSRTGAVVLLTGTLGVPVSVVEAQWAVIDAGNLVQNTMTALNSVATAANTANAYIRQGEQIINEYNIIRHQIEQYQTMVTNLQRMPEGLNFFETINAYGAKLTGLLGQTNALGYQLDDATRQFQELYVEADAVSQGDLRGVQQRFLTARMQASGVAVQIQSIQSNVSDLFGRLCSLLDGSWRAEGNLDSLQLAAQQQALQTTTLQQMQALQATAYRLQTQRQAEDVALERLRTKVLDQFTAPVPEYTGAGGFLPVYRWTDGGQ
jgi:P-type conjugative transfer protein TrbJ